MTTHCTADTGASISRPSRSTATFTTVVSSSGARAPTINTHAIRRSPGSVAIVTP